MKKTFVVTLSLLVMIMVGTVRTVSAAPLCLSTINDGNYLLTIGTAGDAIVVNGIKKSNPQKTPFTGTAFVLPDGTVIMGWTVNFDLSATITGGSWFHPTESVVVKIAPTTGFITFDATYHGNTDFPRFKVTGSMFVASCTGFLTTAEPVGDPNHR
jgi:hypothetical protein